jgi:hypothetical protein
VSEAPPDETSSAGALRGMASQWAARLVAPDAHRPRRFGVYWPTQTGGVLDGGSEAFSVVERTAEEFFAVALELAAGGIDRREQQ